jgi:hypothetical protein
VGAEGAVAEQVAAGAGEAELPDDVQPAALGELAPVPDDPWTGASAGQVQQAPQVLEARHLRSRHLVHRADAERRRRVERGPLGGAPLLRLDRSVGRPPDGVVRVEAELSVGGEAPELTHTGHPVEQGGGDRCRVDVDAGQVGRTVPDDRVDVMPGERAALRPAGLVPAGTQHDPGRRPAGVGGDRRDGLPEARARVEVET